MKKHYDEIRRLGAEVLVVTMTEPAKLAVYLDRFPSPFPVVSDPSLASYRAFELGRTSLGGMLLKSVGGYLKLMAKGWLPKTPNQGEDIMQLGGDFILDKEGKMVYAYRSADPTDRPAAEDLVQAVRKLNQPT